MGSKQICADGGKAERAGPAADPRAPYVRVAVAGLIRRNDGPVATWLLFHRTEPYDAWDPPGGRMEADEDLAMAVKREVEEETGLIVEVGGPCYSYLTFHKGERLLVVSMTCRPQSDPDEVRPEPGGASEWRWVSAAEWEALAVAGHSSWEARTVRKATRMATILWETEDE